MQPSGLGTAQPKPGQQRQDRVITQARGCSPAAARTSTFLASRYKRVVKWRGKNRALVAVGNSILTICWHLLSDPSAHFTDLGPDWHDRLAPQRRKRQLIAELERLSGKKVLLQEETAA